MLLDLDQLKALLGVPVGDTSYDNALIAAGESITRQMEAYCSRGFEFKSAVVEEYMRFYNQRVYLRRFPIQSITELAIGGLAVDPVDLFVSEQSIGWGWIGRRDGAFLVGDVKVTADLGYPPDQVPADLALAFARACGVASGYGTGSTGSSGASSPIKTLGLGQGALSIGFDTGRVTGGVSGSYDVSEVPAALQSMADVLQFYRRIYF